MVRRLLLSFLAISLTQLSIAQTCDTTQLQFYEVRASDTDPNIDWELAKHHAYFNPDCVPQNKLLIWIPGTWGNPTGYQRFCQFAANHGFHVISLKYINNVYASQFCGSSSDPACFQNFRHEHVFGTDLDPNIDIDSTDCLINRSVKLLQYLEQNFPADNWGQYLNGNDLNWQLTVPAGHSQGSGHAAYMGYSFPVHRVLMFGGLNEYHAHFNAPANWLNNSKATPDSCFYGFANANDEIAAFAAQLWCWNTIGMGAYGDSIAVDGEDCPFEGHRNLYIDELYSGAISINHGSMVSDNYVPNDSNGAPQWADAWQYMLGVCDEATGIGEAPFNDIEYYPNPATDWVSIQLDNPRFEVELFTVDGKMVLHESTASLQMNIDVTPLESGVYLLIIAQNGRQIPKKIIVQ